jgi:HlyD family secretion protein
MDDDRARERSAQAAVTAARAQVAAAQSAIEAAQAQVVGAQSTVAATQATIARIRADIDDSELKAPRDGRIQYRVAQPAKCSAPAARY